MGHAANDRQAFGVLLGVLSALGWLSTAGCGGLADHRRGGEPTGMLAMGGATSQTPAAACDPLLDTCEPAGSGEVIYVTPCTDNPFIVDCYPPQPSPDVPSEPEPELPPESAPPNIPSEAAENVLHSNCGQCHGPLPERADSILGGLGDIQDFEALRQAGYIVDCAAESSRIIQVMRSQSMPPPSSGLPPVTPADIEVVAFAIEVGCTDSERLCATDPASPGCGVVLAERALERNCGACHGERARGTAPGGYVENLDYIDDLAKLIENEKVVPCESERSSVLVRARDGSMPPPPSRVGPNGSPLSPRDDAAVASFIDGLCPGPAAPEDTEQLRVEELLGTYCGECHGQRAVELGQVQGNIDDIESVDASIRAGRLVPCYSEGSLIVQQLRDGSMPPPASTGPRPSDAEIQLIADFVERPCAGP